ncbi:class I SAM-dependent methyltransferase [Chloroflexota bacterium]
MTTDKELVQEYWDKEPADSTGIASPEGSLQFFEAMEERRYRDEAYIHSLAQFTRWRGKKVLEVGCGCGTDLLQFARAGAEVYGIDLSQHSVELTRKHLKLYGLQAEVNQGDGEDLPFTSKYFDLVYSWGVIHHAPHPSKVVAETYRVLKPGGYIKVMVYSRSSPVWLKMWFQHALLKGRVFTSLSRVISEHMESPGTKAFTMKETKRLFCQFRELEFRAFPRPELGFLGKYRALSWLVGLYPYRFASWMTVQGRKPNELNHR